MQRLRNILFCFLLLILSPSFAQTWEPVGGGVFGGDSLFHYAVSTLCVYNNKLYVGGSFARAGKLKVNHIASWDGIKWDSVGGGANGTVQVLYVYKNMLCVGGPFSTAGKTQASCIAFWVDTLRSTRGWYALGEGLTWAPSNVPRDKGRADNMVLDLTEYNGSLYVIYTTSQNYSLITANIKKWDKKDGWSWLCKPQSHDEGASSLMGFTHANPQAFAVYDRDLCIGGCSLFANENRSLTSILCEWNNGTMNPIGKGSLDNQCFVFKMAVFDSTLYVATQGLAKWNGSEWSIIGKWKRGRIFAMAKYKGKIYVGGDIDTVSGKPANGMACWDGNSWQPVGTGFSTNKKHHSVTIRALCVYKGELYAAGDFTSSSGKPMMNIAKLSTNNKPNSHKK